jgi:predicted ATPase
MKILELTISNFQSIGEPVSISFEQITLLIGPNSVGKSAIFDALDLLNALGAGDLVKARTIESSGVRRDKFSPIEIKITVEPEEGDRAAGRNRIPEVDSFRSNLGSRSAPVSWIKNHAEHRWYSKLWGLFSSVSQRFEIEVALSRGEDDIQIDTFRVSRNEELLFEHRRVTPAQLNPYFEEIERRLERKLKCMEKRVMICMYK